MNAGELVREAQRQGASFRLRADGTVGLVGSDRLSASLLEDMRARRDSIAIYLCQIGARAADESIPACRQEEWQVDCAAFTVLETADVVLEMNRGACIACGATWAMHDGPEPASWRRVADPDVVIPAPVRFVIAAARAIALEAAR